MGGASLVLMPPVSPVAPEIKQTLLDAIAAAGSPVPVGELGTLPSPGRKLPKTRVQALLKEDLAAGRVFLWGDSKNKAYWHRDSNVAARDRVLHIAGSEALEAKQLEQRAAAEQPTIALKVVKSARAQLENEKRLRKESKIIVNVERPHPFLELKIAELLSSHGIQRGADRIRELLGGNEPQPKLSSVEEVAGRMFAALKRLAFAPGTTVTFFRLRQEPELANVPKEVFDRAALLLQRDRRALLSVHDHAAALPPEEQQRLVTDGLGTYYVSIYAR